jgi:hypothetical protein
MDGPQEQIPAHLVAVESVVSRYIKWHMGLDAALSAAGFLPFPGAGTAALVTAIVAQAPFVFQPMVREIAAVYAVAPDHYASDLFERTRPTDVGKALGKQELANEFGSKYLVEHVKETLRHHVSGVAASALPIIGGFFAMGTSVIVAHKVTMTIAGMAVLHFENSGEWLESKHKTRAIVTAAIENDGTGGELAPFFCHIVRKHIRRS